MKNSEFLLFFFIFINMFLIFLLVWTYYSFKEVIDTKDSYIEKLHFQLANLKKK